MFNSRVGKVGTGVAKGSPPQQPFFVAALPRRQDAKMGSSLVTRFGVIPQVRVYNEDSICFKTHVHLPHYLKLFLFSSSVSGDSASDLREGRKVRIKQGLKFLQ